MSERMRSVNERLYRPQEVAALFNVNVKTVSRWANEGIIPSFKTPGGHRRYPADTIDKFLRGEAEA